MASKATLRARVALALLAVVLALAVTGCGGNKANAPTADFVGKWIAEGGPKDEIVLDLQGDGRGSNKLNLYPHEQGCWWSVVSNELVVTPMDGSQATRYGYKFDGRDILTLTQEGKLKKLLRVKK